MDKERRGITAEVREVREDNRRATFVASTRAVDRHGTIVEPSGIRTERFDQNPIFLWSHDGYGGWDTPDPANVIGRVVDHRVEGDRFIVEVEFTPPGVNERADMLYRLVRDGFLNAVSIGFNPLRQHEEIVEGASRVVFDEVELLDVSLVPIPSNPEALAIVRAAARAVEGEPEADRGTIEERRGEPEAAPDSSADLAAILRELRRDLEQILEG